jgi:hypothetical protein
MHERSLHAAHEALAQILGVQAQQMGLQVAAVRRLEPAQPAERRGRR